MYDEIVELMYDEIKRLQKIVSELVKMQRQNTEGQAYQH